MLGYILSLVGAAVMSVANQMQKTVRRFFRWKSTKRAVSAFRRWLGPSVLYVCLPEAQHGGDGGVEGLSSAPPPKAVRMTHPPRKESHRTRLVVISDTHDEHDELPCIPECDVLIHCGDSLHLGGKNASAKRFIAWVHRQLEDGVARRAVCIGGNHDKALRKWGPEKCRDAFSPATYLEDSSADVAGLRMYGTPHTYPSKSSNTAWQYISSDDPTLSDRVLQEKWAAIPDDTEVLVSHAPPLDPALGIQEGSPQLAERVRGLKRLKVHVFGHDHKQHGVVFSGAGVAVCAAASMRIPWLTVLPLPLRPPIVVDV